jgi:hypothetical protein
MNAIDYSNLIVIALLAAIWFEIIDYFEFVAATILAIIWIGSNERGDFW